LFVKQCLLKETSNHQLRSYTERRFAIVLHIKHDTWWRRAS